MIVHFEAPFIQSVLRLFYDCNLSIRLLCAGVFTGAVEIVTSTYCEVPLIDPNTPVDIIAESHTECDKPNGSQNEFESEQNAEVVLDVILDTHDPTDHQPDKTRRNESSNSELDSSSDGNIPHDLTNQQNDNEQSSSASDSAIDGNYLNFYFVLQV